jgi:hypothetical protein
MNETGVRRLLTRRTLVRYVNEKLGIPLKLNSLNKMALRGAAPEPDGYYGRVELFTEETAETWALESLCTDKPAKLGVE